MFFYKCDDAFDRRIFEANGRVRDFVLQKSFNVSFNIAAVLQIHVYGLKINNNLLRRSLCKLFFCIYFELEKLC